MLSISKPIYVYLQRPDSGEWVTLAGTRQANPEKGFDDVAHWLDQDWKNVLHQRLTHSVVVLSGRQGLNDQR